MTLQLELDQFHGDGELVDVHAAVAVHVGQGPANTRGTLVMFRLCVSHLSDSCTANGRFSQRDSPDLSQDGRGQA